MTTQYPKHEFDDWAAEYDLDVDAAQGFPFNGYADVLGLIVEWAQAQPGQRLLDLGTGTGNLARYFVKAGCKVWGTDFSGEMLKLAREKVPQAQFVEADLTQGWTKELPDAVDVMVSAYVFHHFKAPQKVEIIRDLMQHLTPGGCLVIGDLSFADERAMDKVRREHADSWDEEDYWIVDEDKAALESAGMKVKYQQVSFCAGVYLIRVG